jgi:phenylacetate-CoA ligase
MNGATLDCVRQVAKSSRFYARKFGNQDLMTWNQISFTTKSELVEDQSANPPYGTNFTRPISDFTRLHQTSGTTTGKPLRWLDTAESWQWVLDRWDIIYRHVGIQSYDRMLFAFSFGPFLGFWSAFESAVRQQVAVFPAGGMTSSARLRYLLEHDISIVLCTPTYAVHLAQVAEKDNIDLIQSKVRGLIVAGEPGGLIPATRHRIESAWGARVFDHYGLTEVGPVAVEPLGDDQALLVVEGYLAEVIDPISAEALGDDQTGELVLTNLGRSGSPLIRYRTGDIIRAQTTPQGKRLVGGILGRTDDMLHIRGNNVYPTAIESIIRRFPEIDEFRATVDGSGPMTELLIEIETRQSVSDTKLEQQVAQVMRDELLFRPTIVSVNAGTLPRFEMKAKRFHRKEHSGR